VAALNLANIPNQINSYERLLMWAAQCCQSISNGLQVNAVAGETQVPLAQVQIAKTADNVDRAICVVYLPINFDALNSATQKTWMAAQDISLTAPNSNLLSN
jgi:hypothetical protein